MSAMMMAAGPMPHPIVAKVTPEHITQSLGLAEKELVQDHEDRHRHRGLVKYVVTSGLGFVLLLVVIFLAWDKADLLLKVLGALALLLGGLGGGVGIKSLMDRD